MFLRLSHQVLFGVEVSSHCLVHFLRQLALLVTIAWLCEELADLAGPPLRVDVYGFDILYLLRNLFQLAGLRIVHINTVFPVEVLHSIDFV